ncbi:hypothetical protein Ciccas_010493 [Cichlidogyrus casuarinus]|uniref:Uncharacterized protein n=1 Tax=Cichlidogyrus casuarinus TaxID=1844966 RepID=A0ABD2PV38_9PLAT
MTNLQQYVVAEEPGPGGVKKTFSFPAGESPGDMTLLRAAVAANQPQDAFIPEDFDEGDDADEIYVETFGNMGPVQTPMQTYMGEQAMAQTIPSTNMNFEPVRMMNNGNQQHYFYQQHQPQTNLNSSNGNYIQVGYDATRACLC